MKYRLLDFLVDPGTGEAFDLFPFEAHKNEKMGAGGEQKCAHFCYRLGKSIGQVEGGECSSCSSYEIVQGKLVSQKSKNEYPIINGIPRILPKELLATLLNDSHVAFWQQYGSEFGASGGIEYDVEREKIKTVNAFGYQWRAFVDNYSYFKEIFLSFTRPFMDEKDFSGKTLLEIGCGSGRPGVAACQMGAEVVGMDISEAVESAYIQSLKIPNFHVVQGDAYAPPFRPVFDVVYSVGVLQHIPSPRKALVGISKVVAPGRPLLLWVYGRREIWYQPIEWARTYTRKMSHAWLRRVSVLMALISEIFLLMPFRLMSRIPLLKELAEKIPGRIYAQYPFRENVVGWFDRLVAPVTYYFSENDIRSLLEETGFDDVEVFSRPDASASWVVFARKKMAE